MNFLNPTALFLLLGLPFIVVFFWWRNSRKQKRLAQLGSLQTLFINTSRLWPIMDRLLYMVCFTALIIALARPTWGTELQAVETEGISIIFLLDVSRSMATEDVLPNRLERAKQDIRNLVTLLDGNEFTLIPFARSAFVYTPATTDVRAFIDFLNLVDTNTISQQGTAIDRAIERALQTLDGRIGIKPIIIILSDGENTDGNPTSILESAIQEGILINTIGYGTTEGAAIPIYDAINNLTTYQSDETGNIVFSKLDDTLLQTIAERTGGIYLNSLQDNLDTLIQYIKQGETGLLGNRIIRQPIERFGLFLLIAFIALTIDMAFPVIGLKRTSSDDN